MRNPRTPSSQSAAIALVTVLAVLLPATGARADEGDASSHVASANKLTEDGLSLYKRRDYRRAIEKFLQAFALDPDPNLLFNTARCYEAMGDSENALEKYEDFLTKPDADPQGKRRATDAIRGLRLAQIQAKEAQSVSATAVTPSGGAAARNAPAAIAVPAREQSSATSGPAESSFWNATTITLGTGVVSLAAGAVAYAMGMADHNKVTGSAGYGVMGQVNPLTEGQAQQFVDSGDTKKLIGAIGLGVGGALVATSAALFIFGSHSEAPANEPGKVAFGISPTADGGRILLQGRF
jgi:hypothetical protein